MFDKEASARPKQSNLFVGALGCPTNVGMLEGLFVAVLWLLVHPSPLHEPGKQTFVAFPALSNAHACQMARAPAQAHPAHAPVAW